MTAKMNREAPAWITKKAKALVAGFLIAGAMVVSSLTPAHAATTFTVNNTSDAPDAFTTSNTCDTDVFTNGN
jgi:hypothetical protein